MNSAIRMGQSSLRDREILECILLIVSMLAIEHVCCDCCAAEQIRPGFSSGSSIQSNMVWLIILL
jgi:hypothetical protein